MVVLVFGFFGTLALSALILVGFWGEPGFPEERLLSDKNVTFVFGHAFFFAMAVAHLLELLGAEVGFLKALAIVPVFFVMDLLLIHIVNKKARR